MTLLGWIVIALAVVWILATRGKKKRTAKIVDRTSPIDAFVVESVARAAARRSAISQDALETALRGDPEPDIVGRLEELVREVEVAFERLPDGAFEVRTRVHFEDTTVDAAARRFEEDQLPAAVQADLARTGASRAFRRWDFPWASSASAKHAHWTD